jgi:hypothetical protein
MLMSVLPVGQGQVGGRLGQLVHGPGQGAAADLPGPVGHSRSPDRAPQEDGRNRGTPRTLAPGPRGHSGMPHHVVTLNMTNVLKKRLLQVLGAIQVRRIMLSLLT